jgi:hypothetical protein
MTALACGRVAGRLSGYDRLMERESLINVWRGAVDVDTAESAVGVT